MSAFIYIFYTILKWQTAPAQLVPASILVLMKWISRLNLEEQGPGPIMRELRLNRLWLIFRWGCCEAPPAWYGCPHVLLCVLCLCVQNVHVSVFRCYKSEHTVTVATQVCRHVEEERTEHPFPSPSLVFMSLVRERTDHLSACTKIKGRECDWGNIQMIQNDRSLLCKILNPFKVRCKH